MTYRIGIDLGGTKTEILVLAPGRGNPAPPRANPRRLCRMPCRYRRPGARGGSRNRCRAPVSAWASPAASAPPPAWLKTPTPIALNGHPFDKDLRRSWTAKSASPTMPTASPSPKPPTVRPRAAKSSSASSSAPAAAAGSSSTAQSSKAATALAGEFGHTPLPWPRPEEMPLRTCWCGQTGCLETYLSGPAFAQECDGPGAHDATQLPARAAAGRREPPPRSPPCRPAGPRAGRHHQHPRPGRHRPRRRPLQPAEPRRKPPRPDAALHLHRPCSPPISCATPTAIPPASAAPPGSGPADGGTLPRLRCEVAARCAAPAAGPGWCGMRSCLSWRSAMSIATRSMPAWRSGTVRSCATCR